MNFSELTITTNDRVDAQDALVMLCRMYSALPASFQYYIFKKEGNKVIPDPVDEVFPQHCWDDKSMISFFVRYHGIIIAAVDATLKQMETDQDVYNLSLVVTPEYQRLGVATWVVCQCLAYAERNPDMFLTDRFLIIAETPATSKIALKCGFIDTETYLPSSVPGQEEHIFPVYFKAVKHHVPLPQYHPFRISDLLDRLLRYVLLS